MNRSPISLRPTCAFMLLLVGSLCASPARGQDAPAIEYMLHCSAELLPHQEKFLLEGLRDQDPNAKMRVQPSAMSVYVRSGVPMDLGVLQAHVAPSGLMLVELVPLAHRNTSTSNDPGLFGPPVYIDTGDPVVDQARYAADKIAWRLANPVHEVEDQIDPTPED